MSAGEQQLCLPRTWVDDVKRRQHLGVDDAKLAHPLAAEQHRGVAAGEEGGVVLRYQAGKIRAADCSQVPLPSHLCNRHSPPPRSQQHPRCKCPPVNASSQSPPLPATRSRRPAAAAPPLPPGRYRLQQHHGKRLARSAQTALHEPAPQGRPLHTVPPPHTGTAPSRLPTTVSQLPAHSCIPIACSLLFPSRLLSAVSQPLAPLAHSCIPAACSCSPVYGTESTSMSRFSRPWIDSKLADRSQCTATRRRRLAAPQPCAVHDERHTTGQMWSSTCCPQHD